MDRKGIRHAGPARRLVLPHAQERRAVLKDQGMRITDATPEQIQMLSSCVYSTKMAAFHEFQTIAKGGDPTKLERGKQLAALLEFCDMYMQCVQNPLIKETPSIFPPANIDDAKKG